jgi:cytochrome c nitrite reductase small subunit
LQNEALHQNSSEETAPAGRMSGQHSLSWQIGILPLAVALMLGLLAGLGFFTFIYGHGASYLSNDPAACKNCHIMQDHYDAWLNSSHKDVATCNDCHLPHNFLGKWITKTDNGFFHSLAFTTGDFHEPIQIKPRNARVTQNACLHCHGNFVQNMLPQKPGGDMLFCVKCHSDVGHDERP